MKGILYRGANVMAGCASPTVAPSESLAAHRRSDRPRLAYPASVTLSRSLHGFSRERYASDTDTWLVAQPNAGEIRETNGDRYPMDTAAFLATLIVSISI
jgi:hypothetical protein